MRCSCFSVLSLALSASVLPAALAVGEDPAASITVDELREHILWLASDDLEGRYPGSKGYEIAAHYGAVQFEEAGLNPIARDSEGAPTFLQLVPIVRRTVGKKIAMVLDTSEGKKEFSHGADFVWARGELPLDPAVPRELVFAGYGIERPGEGWNDLEDLDIKGKIAVLLMGAPVKGDAPVLTADTHGSYQGIGGIFLKIHELRRKEPAGIIFIADEMILDMWSRIPPAAARNPVMYPGSGETVPDPTVMIVKPEAAVALFAGQAHDPPVDAGENLDKLETYLLDGVTMSLAVDIEDELVPTWNVLGIVDGTDRTLDDQFVVVMGHLDHKEPVDGQVMNGASDNASGSAAVMEIAEAVALDPPRRPVVFILLAAEECGMHGARHFLCSGLVPAENIVVDINIDAVGRAGPSSPGSRGHGVFNPFTVNPELTDVIREVNARTGDWPLNYVEEIADLSDDMWFRVKGIPSILLFSGKDSHYHKPTDDVESIDFEQVLGVTRLSYHLVMELGDRKVSIRP
jgi:hypothetical protein